MMESIDEGSFVLLFHTDRKKWLTRVAKGKKMHTHLGIIDLDNVIGLEYGNRIKTAKDKNIYLLKPTIYDFIMKSERKTQIVYPKDLGYIAARTGLSNGFTVLEVGTGSGALTTFMASIVKPNGHVHTFDVRPEFMEIAKKAPDLLDKIDIFDDKGKQFTANEFVDLLTSFKRVHVQ